MGEAQTLDRLIAQDNGRVYNQPSVTVQTNGSTTTISVPIGNGGYVNFSIYDYQTQTTRNTGYALGINASNREGNVNFNITRNEFTSPTSTSTQMQFNTYAGVRVGVGRAYVPMANSQYTQTVTDSPTLNAIKTMQGIRAANSRECSEPKIALYQSIEDSLATWKWHEQKNDPLDQIVYSKGIGDMFYEVANMCNRNELDEKINALKNAQKAYEFSEFLLAEEQKLNIRNDYHFFSMRGRINQIRGEIQALTQQEGLKNIPSFPYAQQQTDTGRIKTNQKPTEWRNPPPGYGKRHRR